VTQQVITQTTFAKGNAHLQSLASDRPVRD
jgi:hypothetical protein